MSDVERLLENLRQNHARLCEHDITPDVHGHWRVGAAAFKSLLGRGFPHLDEAEREATTKLLYLGVRVIRDDHFQPDEWQFIPNSFLRLDSGKHPRQGDRACYTPSVQPSSPPSPPAPSG